MLSRHLKQSHHIGWRHLRVSRVLTFAAQVESKQNNASDVDLENARPYSEVPGPSKFELIRLFMPGGLFSKKPFFTAIREMEKTYGQIFRFPGIFDKPEVVINLNPSDYSNIFRNEGLWPDRRIFETNLYHREKHRPELFKGVEGIVST
ncbi:probable cytochrome P450 12e1, mitochondrial [Bactrocera tryoni]|uniref:probable cytochrome P450 12e1, mitochondrial n=1 Tax=Bactrocera tryoni TaxID=59916 RepID=UPI001A9640FE|nr:probable cytochrome P450 12e1, mitochondrial [Bactrocera tryoni]